MSELRRCRRRAVVRAVWGVGALAAMVPAVGEGVARSWVGPSGGSWNTPGNWSGGVVPGNLDTATVTVSPFTSYSIAMNANYPLGGEVNGVTLSATSGQLTLNQTVDGTALRAGLLMIGNSGTRVNYNQSAGVLSGVNAFELGVSSGATGAYTLSGTGTLTNTAYVAVGSMGTGLVAQGGGVATVGTLYIGAYNDAVGSYTLSGTSAALNTTHTRVGQDGVGTFAQSGGTHSVSGTLSLADFMSTSTGTYSLSGTGLLSTPTAYIGKSGKGTFVQSGGTHTLSGTAYVGFGASATGSYTLSDGTFRSASLRVAESGTGTFTQTGGTLNVTSTLAVAGGATSTGYYALGGGSMTAQQLHVGAAGGVATFSHSDGTNTVSSGVIVGRDAGAAGTYLLTGASALLSTTGSTRVGDLGRGTFSQLDGRHLTGTLYLADEVGSTGSYALSAGTVSASTSYVGYDGAGTFGQAGGSHSATNLHVARFATSTGAYTLTGGTLSSSNQFIGYGGQATFAQSGGTNTTSFAYFGYGGGTAAYDLKGGAYTTTATLFLGGTSNAPGGSATLSISGSGTGNFHSLKIWDSPGTALRLSAGGTLNVGTLDRGDSPSRFEWTGGRLHFTGSYTIGNPAIGTSLVVPAGGTLSSTSLSANSGTLTLNGGTLGGPGGLVNHATVTGFGVVDTPVTNRAVFGQAGGNLSFRPGATLTNHGTVTLAAGTSPTLDDVHNLGTFDVNDANASATGTFVNSVSGVLTGAGTLSNSLINDGTIVLEAGSLKVSQFTNTGVVQLLGPTANLTSFGTITNASTLEGYGKVSAPLVNNATAEARGGTLVVAGPLTNNAGGTVRAGAGGKVLVTGAFGTNAGRVDVGAGTVELTQPLTNAGTLSLAGGTLHGRSSLTNAGMISGRGTLLAAGLTNSGQVQLSGGTTDVFAPVTNASGGKVIVSGNATATFYDAVTNDALSEFRVPSGSTAVFFGAVSGVGLFSGAGAKHFEAGASEPGFLATGGETVVREGASLTVDYLQESEVEVYGAVALRPGSGASAVSALAFGAGGTLDLSDNRLTVENTSAGTVRQWITGGRLTSFVPDPQDLYTLGYVPASATGVLVRLTYAGDANLDGVVDADDYLLLDRGYAMGRSDWRDGDFDYSGSVTGADYLLIDRTYVLQGGAMSAELLAMREAQFGSDYVSALTAAVPEPAAGVVAVGALAAIAGGGGRKRRTLAR